MLPEVGDEFARGIGVVELVDADGPRHLPHGGRQREVECSAREPAAQVGDDIDFQVRHGGLPQVDGARQQLVHDFIAQGDHGLVPGDRLEANGEQAAEVDVRRQAVTRPGSDRGPPVPLAQIALCECIESVQGLCRK